MKTVTTCAVIIALFYDSFGLCISVGLLVHVSMTEQLSEVVQKISLLSLLTPHYPGHIIRRLAYPMEKVGRACCIQHRDPQLMRVLVNDTWP